MVKIDLFAFGVVSCWTRGPNGRLRDCRKLEEIKIIPSILFACYFRHTNLQTAEQLLAAAAVGGEGVMAHHSAFVQRPLLSSGCQQPVFSRRFSPAKFRDDTGAVTTSHVGGGPSSCHRCCRPAAASDTETFMEKKRRGVRRRRPTLEAAPNGRLPDRRGDLRPVPSSSSSVAAASSAVSSAAVAAVGAGAGVAAAAAASLAGEGDVDNSNDESRKTSLSNRRTTARVTDARFRRRPPGSGNTGAAANPTLKKQKDYLHLIKASGVRGNWQEVAVLVREMGAKGVTGNVYIYNTAIAAFARCGRPAEAEALLTTMLSRDVAPDTISYNSAINAYARRGDLDAARRLLRRMEELSSMGGGLVRPDQFTYNSVANAAAKRGDAVAAAETLEAMTRAGVTPTLITYNSCLAACKSKGDLKRAVLLLELMREEGISPDQRSYSAAIATAGR